MTPKEAMRLYCQTFQQLTDSDNLTTGEDLALEAKLDDLGPLVYKKLKDPELERWRQQALAELHAYLMGEDVELSALAS